MAFFYSNIYLSQSQIDIEKVRVRLDGIMPSFLVCNKLTQIVICVIFGRFYPI
nr:MAG TPA: hypothetical protein [Caudoviricetes sp.]